MISRSSQWRAVVAAALIPSAVVFAVPGLTENWYARAADEFATKHDPRILITGQAAAFACNMGAAASFALRLTGADVQVSTVTAMVLLAAAVVLDLICLTIFGVSHPNSLHDGYVLSTAFYLTVSSAIFSVAGGSALLVDWINLRADPARFLTPKQRSLSLMSFIFMLYLLIGSLMFKYVLRETFLDSMYFVLSSTLTVGYGDVEPRGLVAKILTIVYFPIGIIQMGIIINLIHDTVLHSVRPRIRQRAVERIRRQESLITTKNQISEKEGVDVPKPPSYEDILRQDIARDEMKSYYREIIIVAILFVVFWIVGALIYMHLEGWSFFIAFYFTFMTYTVIGYGDYSPSTPGGRAFYIGWGVSGIVILTMLFTLVAEVWSMTFADSMRSRVANLSRARRLRNEARQAAAIIAAADRERAGSGAKRDESILNQLGPPRTQDNPLIVVHGPAHLDSCSSSGADLGPPATPLTRSIGFIRRESDEASISTSPAMTPPATVTESQSLAKAGSPVHTHPLRRGSPKSVADVIKIVLECERYLQLILNEDFESIRGDLTLIIMELDGGLERDAAQERSLLNEDQDDIVQKMLLKHTNYQLTKLRNFHDELMASTRTE